MPSNSRPRGLWPRLFLPGLVAGAIVRAIALPLPGTRDVAVWKIWTYNATTLGPAKMYGVGGSPPERRLLRYGDQRTVVDYPPAALYELAVTGRAYRFFAPDFPNTPALTAAIKLTLFVADAALAVLIFVAVRRAVPDQPIAAYGATLAYWLNPAVLLDAAFLGYLDVLFVLPAVAALVAATRGRDALAGALFAVAALTKAQAIFIAPVLVFACRASRASGASGHSPAFAPDRLLRMGAGSFVTAAALLAPIVLAGAWSNMVQALGRLAQHDMLSAYAVNIWWLVTWVLRAAYAAGAMGVAAAWTMPVRILGISRTIELGYPNPRVIGLVLVLAAWGWAMWRARRASDLPLMAGAGAFLVHAYFTLAAQVHENHLFMAIPLAILAAAGRPAFKPVAGALSAILALNLNLFYGFGESVGYGVPRRLTLVDASVLLALVNVAVLAWHAAVLSRECSRAAAVPQSPGPAESPAPAARSRW